MGIVGHGIDVVEVAFFRRLDQDYSQDVLQAYFRPSELEHAGEGPHRAERLAGRYAAKEAVLKALGTGWIDGIAWTDIEIVALPSGAPRVVLHAMCAQLAEDRSITTWLVSISHSEQVAMASVIALE
jgi:holo-[acyl-carrier protein] synthase